MGAASSRAYARRFRRLWFTVSRKAKTVWFPSLMSLVTAAATALIDQLSQLIRTFLSLGETNFWLGLVAVNLFGLTLWYSARILLNVTDDGDFDGARSALWDTQWARRAQAWLPRLLPVPPLLVVLVYLPGWVERGLFVGSAVLAFGAAILSRSVYLTWGEERSLGNRLRQPFARASTDTAHLTATFPELLLYAWFVALMVLIAFVLAVALNAYHELLPMALGSISLLYLGLTGLLVGFLPLAMLAARWHFPVLGIVLIVLATGGTGPEHHLVTTTTANPKHDPAPVPPCTVDRDILIAAEGGGIRAAYWLAAVLAETATRAPDFHCRIAMISSVSGGSLGAVAYTLAYLRHAATTTGPVDAATRGRVQADIERFLGQDLLAPLIAGLLFADLPAATFLSPLLPADRARFFEASLAYSWRNLFAGERRTPDLSSSYHTLAQYSDAIPVLYLNTTRIESGTREFVTTDPNYASPGASNPNVARLLGDRTMSLATALHLGARFPLVSPPGEINVAADSGYECGAAARCWVSYVDGGYYENHGIETLVEYMDAHPRAPENGWKVLVVGNGRGASLRDETFAQASGTPAPLPEIWQPLYGLYQTRGGRALANISDPRLHDALEVLIPRRVSRDIALGWSMKTGAQRRMQRAAAEVAGPIIAFVQR